MLTYTYISKGKFGLVEKPKPMIQHERDAIVKVTLASICSSDLHIKHGSVPRAVEGITVGHEMVGIVDKSLLAEEALTAEGFHVDRNSVTRANVRDRRADFFHDADHLVTDRDSFHRSRHAAVLDVQIA